MSESIPYVYVVVLAFIWRIMSNKNGFSFQMFENCEFKNKNYLYIEKFIMFLLPIVITLVYFLEIVNGMTVKFLLIGIMFVDFLLQFVYKNMKWINTDDKYSKDCIWWVILAVIILIIV